MLLTRFLDFNVDFSGRETALKVVVYHVLYRIRSRELVAILKNEFVPRFYSVCNVGDAKLEPTRAGNLKAGLIEVSDEIIPANHERGLFYFIFKKLITCIRSLVGAWHASQNPGRVQGGSVNRPSPGCTVYPCYNGQQKSGTSCPL